MYNEKFTWCKSMTNKAILYVDFLESVPFFSGFKKENIKHLLSKANCRSYSKNKMLLLHGETSRYLYVITEGWVKLSQETPEGKESIIGLYTRGDTFGRRACLSEGGRYPYNAQIVEDSIILEIPTSDIRYLLKNNNDLAFSMLSSMSKHIGRLELQLEHQRVMSAPERVGCFLIKLAMGQKGGKVTVYLPNNKTLLASSLGMQRETFSRTLSGLKKAGAHVKGSQVIVDDIEKLRNYACSSCSNAGACETFVLDDD